MLVGHMQHEDYHNYQEFDSDLDKMKCNFYLIKCSNQNLQDFFYEQKSKELLHIFG